jgi:hypothetical protein
MHVNCQLMAWPSRDASSISTYRVERRSIDARVDLVSTGDRVRCKQRDNLERREPSSIVKPLQDLRHAVLRLGNQPVDRSNRLVRATGQELQSRSTLHIEAKDEKMPVSSTKQCTRQLFRGHAYRTVAEGNSTSELNQVTSTDRVLRQERNQVVHTVVDAVVGAEVGLDGWKQKHRAVSSSAAVQPSMSDVTLAYSVEMIAHAFGPLLLEIATASSVGKGIYLSTISSTRTKTRSLTEGQTDDFVSYLCGACQVMLIERKRISLPSSPQSFINRVC